MSMDTLHPQTKDDLRENYLRTHRGQDHGTRGERDGHLKTKYESIDWFNLSDKELNRIINAQHRPLDMGQLAVLTSESHLQSQDAFDDKLHNLTSTELEYEATRLLEQGHGNDIEDYVTDAEREAEAYDEDEITKETIQAFHDEVSDLEHNRMAGYGSLGIEMGKRKRGDAERQYQGNTGDDDDPRGDIARGFTITSRP